MPASPPHKAPRETQDCPLRRHLRGASVCVGRAINHVNHVVSGIWGAGSQTVCLWDRGRGRQEEGCGKADQEGVTAQTSLLGASLCCFLSGPPPPPGPHLWQASSLGYVTKCREVCGGRQGV